MDVLDDDMTWMLISGAAMFVVGFLICMRRTRFGRQIAQPMAQLLRSDEGGLRREAFMPVKIDALKIAGIGLMGVGYLMSGTVILFLVPGWGILMFVVGFMGTAAMALWRAR